MRATTSTLVTFFLVLWVILFAGCAGMRETLFNGGFGAEPTSHDSAPTNSPLPMNGNMPCDASHASVGCGSSTPFYSPFYYRGDWKAVPNTARPLTAVEQVRMDQLKSVMHKYLPMVQNLDAYQRLYAPDQYAINAYVTGDSIVVWDGLFNVVDSEDELAVIVGHEIGHIVKNHVNGFNGKNISGILGSMGDIALCLSKQTCDGEASSLMQPVTFMFSRDDEREADDFGFNLLCRAGYNPSAVVSVWKKMASKLPHNNESSWMSTHPSNVERLNTLSAKVSSCHRKQETTPEASNIYEQVQPRNVVKKNIEPALKGKSIQKARVPVVPTQQPSVSPKHQPAKPRGTDTKTGPCYQVDRGIICREENDWSSLAR